MILQALKEYYDRKAADPDSGIAPLGWERKEIPFRVVFDATGKFVRIEDTRVGEGKKQQAQMFTVPSLGEGKGNGTKSNLLWENAEYMFGIPVDDDKLEKDKEKYSQKVEERHLCFIEKIRSLSEVMKDNEVYEAALRFVESISSEEIIGSDGWEKVKSANSKVFIMCYLNDMGKQTPLVEIPAFKAAINQSFSKNKGSNLIRCLVSGEIDELKTLEPDIKGFAATGAHIVAINNKINSSGNGGATPAFSSYMKEKGANSPIGKKASLAYTTALNTLLAKDSRQKIQVGDATAVFWSEQSSILEDEFLDLFGEPAKDNPDKGVDAVKRLLSSVKTGAFSHKDYGTRFYVLGLAPNSTRISVRFWHVGTVAEMEKRFADWFEDLRIAHGVKDKEHLSLWCLLISTATQGKTENINPNLSGSVMRSILSGSPLPDTLLNAVLVRIKAEREISYPRAKLLKAYLNRKSKERKITVSLDKENTNVAYCLGRLFATLEKIQEEANPGINATIRDKFYASASSTPNAVYGNLMRLKNHHLGKLSQGRSIYFEKLLGEVISEVPSFPAHLALDDQGSFAIGYYHQRQDFFTGKQAKSGSDHAANCVDGSAQTEFSL
jgi:CRISPR-associated protein Csd1